MVGTAHMNDSAKLTATHAWYMGYDSVLHSTSSTFDGCMLTSASISEGEVSQFKPACSRSHVASCVRSVNTTLPSIQCASLAVKITNTFVMELASVERPLEWYRQ